MEFKFPKETIFHRYLVSQTNLNKNKKQSNANDLSLTSAEYRTTGSTLHLVKLIKLEEHDREKWPLCVLKRVSFTSQNNVNTKSYLAINPNIRAFSQVKTQYIVFQLLAFSKRAIKLYQMIPENSRRLEDQNFFYKYLGLKKLKHVLNNCIVMEYCNGGDLERRIEDPQNYLVEDDIIDISCQIIDGLNDLKKRGILHRDLRPCNIFLHNGEVKFADFDSSFVYNISQPNDVKNGIDIDTTPPQIVQLASKSEEQLQALGNQKLYKLQQKCDIYFFGAILFKMIFRKNYMRNYEGVTLQYLIKQKIKQNFNFKVLQCMKKCLYWSADKRLDLTALNEEFIIIEREKYFSSNTNKKIYLSEDPLTLFERSDLQNENKITIEQLEQDPSDPLYCDNLQLDFIQYFAKSTKTRFSQLYKEQLKRYIYDNELDKKRNSFNNSHIWAINHQKIHKQQQFLVIVENYIQQVQKKAFYYDFLYKIILRINLRSIKNKEQQTIMKENKQILSKQLVLILRFLFQMLARTLFRKDKLYNQENIPFLARRIFQNLVKINNKCYFFQGRVQTFNYDNSQSFKIIQKFNHHQYTEQQLSNFTTIKSGIDNIMKFIQKRINDVLVETTVDLIKSYNHKSNKQNSVREILFILVICSQQQVQKLRKNQVVILKEMLQDLYSGKKKLNNDEVSIFFEQFRKLHMKVDKKSEHKLLSHKNLEVNEPKIRISGNIQEIHYTNND